MTREERRAYWQAEIARFKASGQSAGLFCRERNVNYYTLRRWRRIFEGGGGKAVCSARFARVEIDKGQAAGVEIRLPMGIAIRSAGHPEPEWVVKLMRQMAWRDAQ